MPYSGYSDDEDSSSFTHMPSPGPRRLAGEGKVSTWRVPNDDTRKLCESEVRKNRLNNGRTETLYHGTTASSARDIQKSGQLRRGKRGYAGPGIYFARTETDAKRKNSMTKFIFEKKQEKNSRFFVKKRKKNAVLF